MSDLLDFFTSIFGALWDFFNIEFPLLGMSVFQVLMAALFLHLAIKLIVQLLKGDEGSGSHRNNTES